MSAIDKRLTTPGRKCVPTGPGKVVVTTNMSRNVIYGPYVIVVQALPMSAGDVNPYVLG